MKQMTIWDYLEPERLDDLSECMKHGMFEGAAIRIYALYHHEQDRKKRAAFLKDEYGIGGRSFTLKSGESGFVDFDSKGVRICSFKTDEKQKYSWGEAEKRVEALIDSGKYMSDEDMEKWESLTERPYPHPAYRYP